MTTTRIIGVPPIIRPIDRGVFLGEVDSPEAFDLLSPTDVNDHVVFTAAIQTDGGIEYEPGRYRWNGASWVLRYIPEVEEEEEEEVVEPEPIILPTLPVLTGIYSSLLSASRPFNTNAPEEIYLWDDDLTDPGITYDPSQGRFIAVERGSYQVSTAIIITDGTANERATFYVVVGHYNSSGNLIDEKLGPVAYIRDDSASFDDGGSALTASFTLNPDEYLQVNTRRIHSQDLTDDNPADITLSRFQLERWSLE